MKNLSLLFVYALGLSCACTSAETETPSAQEPDESYATMEKIDVHAHFQYHRDYLKPFFESWSMRGVLVDVSKQEGDSIRRSWHNYVTHQQQHEQLFTLCSSFIGVGIDHPEYAQKVIAQLQEEISAGAKMVKVWKNFGMVTQDQAGNFIQIDDQRLKPVWDFLVEQQIPVMAHIGEPKQAWLPLDDPNNPHYGYYTNHPEYHAYQHPEIPHYDTIMAARDRWLAQNPQLTVLCAHLGSMSHDVQMVAQRLDRYPNMLVEMGARFGDLAGQESSRVATFFSKYQDRILFGSDYGNSVPQDSLSLEDLELEQQQLADNYQRLWRYLATTDSLVIRNQATQGLGLSEEVLQKVFYGNTASLLGME